MLLLLACTLLLGLLVRQIPEKRHKQIFYTKRTSFKSSRIFTFDIFGKKVELKMYRGKELLSSIRLSGHTIRFHPQTQS